MTISALASFIRLSGMQCRAQAMLARWSLLVVSAVALAPALHAEQTTEVAKLKTEVGRLYRAGKHAEAIPVAKRVLAIRKRTLGPNHPDVGEALDGLATLYRALGRYADAEPLYKRALINAENSSSSWSASRSVFSFI